MAGITIPLITEFKDTGIKQALKEFKKLETAGERAQFAIKKAAVPAAAALGAVVAVIGSATKAAIEDQAAQKALAGQIRRSTGATDKQIAAVEEYIESLGKSVAVSDDEARPAFEKLIVATNDIRKAQELLNVALDVSAATGKDLSSVTEALAKAFEGNMRPLSQLSPELKTLVGEGADLNTVLGVLKTNFGGAATAAADTAAGGMKKLGIAFDETKESIGMAFLPIMEKLQPVLEKFADWAQKNPGLLTAVIVGMGVLAGSILLVNAAMALNPAVAMIAGFVFLGIAIVEAYKKFEGFRDVVRFVVNGILKYVETMVNGFIMGINVIIRALNFVPGISIDTVDKISLSGIGGEGGDKSSNDRGMGGMKAPDLSSNNRGVGGAAGMGGVNVTVNAGLVSTGAQIGQDIIAAIQKAERSSGQVFAAA